MIIIAIKYNTHDRGGGPIIPTLAAHLDFSRSPDIASPENNMVLTAKMSNSDK